MTNLDPAKSSSFVRSWLSEADGTVSNTRICVALVVTFALGWVTALVSKVPGPVSVAELSSILSPMAFFVTGITGTLYGVNKAADVLNNRNRGPEPPQQ
jgi:uncharacterized membrane protein